MVTSVFSFGVAAVASATRSTPAHAPPVDARSQRRIRSTFMCRQAAGLPTQHGTKRRAGKTKRLQDLRSIRALAPLGHERSHHRGLLVAFAQPRDDAGPVDLGPVLADLPLPFDAHD